MNIKRIYVEKKPGFNVEAQNLLSALKDSLEIITLNNVRIINRYDIFGISDEVYQKARTTIFSEPPVDFVYDEVLNIDSSSRIFAIEFLPGQYDQRADSASQCIQLLTQNVKPDITSAKVIILDGNISEKQFEKIKNYCINPVDSREASLNKPLSYNPITNIPNTVETLNNFINMNENELLDFMNENTLAMSFEDLKFCQEYFQNEEKRNPTITEIKVIDTYWSDHCRHTTFQTMLEDISIEDGLYNSPLKEAYNEYLASRKNVYGNKQKNVTLMDIATLSMKELKKQGLLDDLDASDEINACSIVSEVNINNKKEKWLIMFKNETHNHPTEIEPFGGAATCLGGAIRDPLSGRAYVYQAMRVTGSGNPNTKLEDTISGKLPQVKISTSAAHGYSSYGNQIGLATGHVCEVYDEDFVAKRMEIGAVIGAAPAENVVRSTPEEGDIIILVGGRTGRDGCGGATGSSKEHTEESILLCGAEVQKGNAPTERKLQRLFRKPDVTRLIKRCNDFGAGGVSVAIGELTDGLDINLDLVPKKYEGLDGTELAISESQERMAVVVKNEDADTFVKEASLENLEATIVAKVTNLNRLRMTWYGNTIVDISRDFLNTNGVTQKTDVKVLAPSSDKNYFNITKTNTSNCIEELWMHNLSDLNTCSQKGLVERFDSTIGGSTVLMPFGGKYQLTPSQCMAAKIPVLNGDTTTATLMSFGYNPKIAKWSPFHGAVYAVVDSLTKITAAGGNYKSCRLTFQEYFERLGKDSLRWGKPFSALLGAFYVQKKLGIPAIGGKDSMSGTFKDINVPPTLVSFAVNVADVNNIISNEFKEAESNVIIIKLNRDKYELPVWDELDKNFEKLNALIASGKVKSAYAVGFGGISEAISKMSFGNMIGMNFIKDLSNEELLSSQYGSIIVETDKNFNYKKELSDVNYELLGHTQVKAAISINNTDIALDNIINAWEKPLEKVYPYKLSNSNLEIPSIQYDNRSRLKPLNSFAKPRIFIPVFPGTNCEYDTKKAFDNAGGLTTIKPFRNLTSANIEESIKSMVDEINNSQIIMLPGGFSAGDEPDGSGKFIASILRNPYIKEAIMNLLNKRDGLMLGICNGFQALIKLGLLPYGEIRDIDEAAPTLTYNSIGRHVSCMVDTKVASNLSPWFNNVKVGDIHTIAVSHGEGRFFADEKMLQTLIKSGQIATQYVDFKGKPTYEMPFNPNGSVYAIEGITSPDGRILGKMGHSERIGNKVGINISGNRNQKLFEAGVAYFK